MTESNPFQTPASDVAPTNNNLNTGYNKSISCNAMPAMNGAAWVIDGFKNFMFSPFSWILVVLIYIAILGSISMLPFVSIISSIIAPIFMAGLMICAQENNNNQTFQIKNLFDGFKLNGGKLAGLGALNLGVVILIFIVIGIIAFGVLLGSVEDFQNVEQMFDENFLTPENGLLILLFFLIAFALILPITMAFWFAPALVVFHDIEIFESLKLSFMACLKNVLPYLIYSLVFMFIYLIAAIPLIALAFMLDENDPSGLIIGIMILIGIVEVFVLSVVLFTSIYASYEDIFSMDA